jgi:hypothetical protein
LSLLRRSKFWLGAILISLSWREAYGLVTPADPGLAYLIVLVGILCTGACMFGKAHCEKGVGAGMRVPAGRPPVSRSLLSAAVALSAGAFYVAFRSPVGPAALFALSGLLMLGPFVLFLFLRLIPGGRLRTWPAGFSETPGLLLASSGVSTALLLRLCPHFHDIDIPAGLHCGAEALSARLGIFNGLAAFWDGKERHLVRITFEGMGLYEIWYVAAAIAVACLVLFGRRFPLRTLKVLGAAAVYTLIRFVVLVAIAVEFESPHVLWQSWPVLISYLPLAPLLGLASGPVIESPGQAKRVVVVMGVVLGVLILAVLPSRDGRGGEMPSLNVLFDESHSNWEWATEPFDTTSFGIRAEYNYYCFREYLEHFHEVAVSSHALNRETLDAFDILIIKTPTEPYEEAEIDEIVEFVESGGGLFLIGDHTNLFGMTVYLNAIARRFGMLFQNDDTFDLATGGFSSPAEISPWTHPFSEHIQGFRFLTSCTIDGDLETEPLMLGCGLASESGDYGHPNFFGNIAYDLSDRFGVFLQAAGKRFGRGRVLMFTDSTCLSNFCMFSPHTPEIALRFLEYLGEREGPCGGRGLLSGETAHRVGSGPAGRLETVIVDTTHTRASFFDYFGPEGRPQWQRFEEFYLSLSRMGFHPAVGGTDDLARPDAAALIIVNPERAFEAIEIEALSMFVAGGGALLVLDGVANSASSANEVLSAFGMGIVMKPAGSGPGIDRFLPALEVLGGEPVTGSASGLVTTAAQTAGNGVVVAAVDSYGYSEAGLGRCLQHTYVYKANRPQYQSLFRLLAMMRKGMLSPHCCR